MIGPRVMIGARVIGPRVMIGLGVMIGPRMIGLAVQWKKKGSIDVDTGVTPSVPSSVCVPQSAPRW